MADSGEVGQGAIASAVIAAAKSQVQNAPLTPAVSVPLNSSAPVKS